MTLSLRCWKNWPPPAGPVPNQTVNLWSVPAGPLANLPATRITDSDGRASVVIWAISGAATQPSFPVEVWADWAGGPMTHLTITLRSEIRRNDQAFPTKPALLNQTNIRVWYQPSIQQMRPKCDQTNPDWDEGPCPNPLGVLLDFVGDPNWQIEFKEDYARDESWYGWTTLNSADGTRTVRFNMFNVDGAFPDPITGTTTAFPKFDDRHHLQGLANHEVGHALWFGDGTWPVDARNALMHGWIDNYFVWKTVLPQTPNETVPLALGYPCP